ncbi:glycosyltransferase family 2 protein [Mucilaginibacter lappiensis]|jgi:glycosyltransferase involved in cell wall biosynthesis|uniref:glycosyltransferase family 2 protein n=1 Tax=Mucilaginibacter lappiensis TaxID=354630 RepID=UPI003D242CA6
MSIHISVIIPNYNHARFLQQRIETVLCQSYQNFELIILDDASTDNSKDIIETYRYHPKVSHIIYNSVNSCSTFKQWNKGIELASGKYIWIAESDDYADCEFINTCMTKMLADDTIGLVYTDSTEINENNAPLGRWSRWMEYLDINLWQADFELDGREINSKYNHIICAIPNASCSVFKKSAYLNTPFVKLIENLRFTGDWWTWFSLMQESRVYYCHLPLNYFRYHAHTTRSNVNARLVKVKELYRAILKFKKMVDAHPDKNIRQKRLSEIYAIWNPSLRHFFIKENMEVLKLALSCDAKVPYKLFRTVLKRLNAV